MEWSLKKYAERMKALAKEQSARQAGIAKLFEGTWRLAVLLLPWQIRWFQEGPLLGGYPWEGGRSSVYLSWLPLLATIILGVLDNPHTLIQRARAWTRVSYARSALLSGTILISISASSYRIASIQWWVEVLFLSAFASILARRVKSMYLVRWMVYALVPHAVLGIHQYLTQMVGGSKWLGIASQDPLIPGVSVVQAEGRRVLRAYGGLPHPNILGGWLVLGVGCLLLTERAFRPWVEKILIGLFSVTLVLTFSRSAWAAVIVLWLGMGFSLFHPRRAEERRRVYKLLGLVVLGMALTMVWCAPLVRTRAYSGARLEVRSLDERARGWFAGVEIWKRHPWLGVGPRAVNFALHQEGLAGPHEIPIPPHNVFLLALAEMGSAGVLIGAGAILLCIKRQAQRVNPSFLALNLTEPPFLLFFAYVPILFLDHYPWSTWSGLTLMALTSGLLGSYGQAKKRCLDMGPKPLAIYGSRD